MLLYHQSAAMTAAVIRAQSVLSSCLHQHVMPKNDSNILCYLYIHMSLDLCRDGPRTCGSGAAGCTLGVYLLNRILSPKSSSLNMLVRYDAPCWSDLSILVQLEEPCCPCTYSNATAVALCKLNHLGQHALVVHAYTHIHARTPARTHAHMHALMCSALQRAASQQGLD